MNARLAERLRTRPPVVRQECDGVAAGLSVDRIVADGDFLALSGWVIGGQDLTFTVASGTGVPTIPSLSFFPRDDVAAGYKVARNLARGFLAIWRTRPHGDMQVRLACVGAGEPLQIELPAPEASSWEELSQLLTENLSRARYMLGGLFHNPIATSVLTKDLAEPPPGFNRARGHLEVARGLEGVGGLVVGWTVAEPGLFFCLVDEEGRVVALSSAARWTRDDIVEAMANNYGDYVFNAGFLQGWTGALRIGGSLRLIVSTDDASYMLSEIKWSLAPVEPVSFARWAFELPTPREKFAERLTHHDGAIINALIERKIERRPKTPPAIQQYGRRPPRPKCAVVVPLYGRHDFMLNQLLAFSDDPGFVSGVDLIYVIDDHRLVSPLAVDAPMFEASFGVPFRTIWGGENRGFAGATNLGVANSSAPFILLLNSDVIPIASGWLEKMCSVLAAHPEIGLLGARLHHPSGAVQHDGMGFRWEPTWQAYLNKHPGAGLPGTATSGKFVKRQAVTAACAMTRREVYEAVAGLDEKFLIGDFEDSDLCLKVREQGLEIACLPLPVTLIHLERQSLNAIGTSSFRDYVARYNAWRHQARWGAAIAELSGVDAGRARSK